MGTTGTERDIQGWVEISRYDPQTARAMFRSRKYVYVLFMCQQSLEKLLKARFIAMKKEFPPRIHDLTKLAEVAALEVSTGEKRLLERLSLHYLRSRYPPDVRLLMRRANRQAAASALARSEELWRRVRRSLSSGR